MINRLLVFFALVYVVEGVGQVEGLIAQPLSFYLKEVHGWTALEVSAYLTIFNFPWIIKPLYGAFSDFVPLLGYRRKPYLLAANIVAAGAFLWVTQLTAPGELLWALELTAYAMAMSSTVCGAVLVENGQRLGECRRGHRGDRAIGGPVRDGISHPRQENAHRPSGATHDVR